LLNETNLQKSRETDAKWAKDMSPRRGKETIPMPEPGDTDGLVKWNAFQLKCGGNGRKLTKDTPMSHKLTREHIRAWK
jgi:hypothetical protein